jgi:hypothetical protein
MDKLCFEQNKMFLVKNKGERTRYRESNRQINRQTDGQNTRDYEKGGERDREGEGMDRMEYPSKVPLVQLSIMTGWRSTLRADR